MSEHDHAICDMDYAELRRLRKLLQDAADKNEGALSSHCCEHCVWCPGRLRRVGEPWDLRFVHEDTCPVYTPDGKVRESAP